MAEQVGNHKTGCYGGRAVDGWMMRSCSEFTCGVLEFMDGTWLMG